MISYGICLSLSDLLHSVLVSMILFIKKIMDMENRLVVATGEGEGGGEESGMDWEFGVNRCKLLFLECISHEILLCSTENYV